MFFGIATKKNLKNKKRMHRSIAPAEIEHNPPFDRIHNLSCADLRHCKLTDSIASDLYKYVTNTHALRQICLRYNRLGDITYHTLAAALCFSLSVKIINLNGNLHVDFQKTSISFTNTIRLNRSFDDDSRWFLFGIWNEYPRLLRAAITASPPSMLEFLLYVHKC